jgi:hypothetical protein
MQLVEQSVFRVKGASQGLALVPVHGDTWAEEVHKEAWSPVYGQKAPMTVLNFGTITEVPAEFVLMLVVLEEIHPGARSLTRIVGSESDSTVRAYEYAEEAGDYFFFFAEPGKPWRQNSVSSDAEFVCWRRTPGSPDHLLILCNGSYTEIKGGPEVRCRRAVRWCEVRVEGGRKTVRSSDPEAVETVPDDSGQQFAPLNRSGA